MRLFLNRTLALFGVAALFLIVPRFAAAATLSLSSSNTSFEVGETFDVSILLDTEGQDINAVELGLEFPADKLQVVSPNTGRSIIEIWAGQPKFNNKTGRVEMRGGFPGGITITNGLITTVRFRVKASGSSFLQFTPDTKILANDGRGTDVLVHTPGVVYSAVLPKAAGPIVSSPTHPDQAKWYSNSDVVFNWEGVEGAEGYSFILNGDALFKPDTISEGTNTTISYTQLQSGTYYFHVRVLQGGVWGGVTHYQVNVDKTAPAEFNIEAVPSARTSSRQPVLKFFSTDAQSGIDHFELKILSLAPVEDGQQSANELFSDAQSPYVVYPLELGSYEVIVRAYDKAQNYRETKERLTITTPIFSLFQDNGIQLTTGFTLTWPWIWGISLLILLFFLFASWRLKHWPRKLGIHKKKDEIPDAVREQLEQLRAYQRKYGKIAVMLLFALSLSLGSSHVVAASALTPSATDAILTPPLIVTVSNDITTADTFYIGGETVTPNTEVVVYWNNLTTGETQSAVTESNESGEWFYHHPGSSPVGNYVLWAQSSIGETLSPPSPQFTMIVRSDALHLGPARISYEFAYLAIIAVLLIVLLASGVLIIRKWHLIKRKHRQFMEELRTSEESIRRGFAVLRRDLEVEFNAIKALGSKRSLSKEEATRERQIETDIEAIQAKIGKEIWQLEKIENDK